MSVQPICHEGQLCTILTLTCYYTCNVGPPKTGQENILTLAQNHLNLLVTDRDTVWDVDLSGPKEVSL